MQFSDQRLNKLIKIMVIITLFLASLYIFSQFNGFISNISGAISSVLTPFLIAFFINFLIYPLVMYMEEKGLRPRWLIVLALYIIIFSIFGLILYKLIPYVSAQIEDLALNKIPEIYNSFNQKITDLHLENNTILNQIYTNTETGLQNYLTGVSVALLTSVKKIFSLVLTLVLSPIILFYMLKDHNLIGEGLYKAMPNKYKEHFIVLTKRINETLGLYIRGQVIVMFGIGVISTLGYTLIGLDYAVVFGLIVGLTNIIPYIGATIAATVPITYSLLVPGTVPWYYILLLNLGFQFVEGNILQPVIMSKQLDIHPLVILAAILGFGSLFGVLGVVFAVPITGIIKVCILYYHELKEKNEVEGYEV